MASCGMLIGEEVRDLLLGLGAGIVGYADMAPLPAAARAGLPRAISVAVPLNPVIVEGIWEGPTKPYHAEYERINHLLDILAHESAELLLGAGYRALPFAPTNVGIDYSTLSTRLPHRTAATRAGLGWIGKCALLVTDRFGSAVRLTTVLTDAELLVGEPVTESRCGQCMDCVEVCPGQAPSGRGWVAGISRDSFFDAFACRRAARSMAARIGLYESVCGMCIAACPWTNRYIERGHSALEEG